jgi:hypothetical protein
MRVISTIIESPFSTELIIAVAVGLVRSLKYLNKMSLAIVTCVLILSTMLATPLPLTPLYGIEQLSIQK